MVYVSFVYSTRIQRQCSSGAEPGYVRYTTFFHTPKGNEGESNSTLITWFPYRSPCIVGCAWLTVKTTLRFFLVTGLVILKLTQPLIPADNPNSSYFYGTEGVTTGMTLRVFVFVQRVLSKVWHIMCGSCSLLALEFRPAEMGRVLIVLGKSWKKIEIMK